MLFMDENIRLLLIRQFCICIYLLCVMWMLGCKNCKDVNHQGALFGTKVGRTIIFLRAKARLSQETKLTNQKLFSVQNFLFVDSFIRVLILKTCQSQPQSAGRDENKQFFVPTIFFICPTLIQKLRINNFQLAINAVKRLNLKLDIFSLHRKITFLHRSGNRSITIKESVGIT